MYKLLHKYIGGNNYIILADLNKHKAQQLIDKGLIPISINVKNLKIDEDFSNEVNDDYSQRFVYSLKKFIQHLLR